jgi:hypothetical protein
MDLGFFYEAISVKPVHVWAARILQSSSASVYSHPCNSNYNEDNMGTKIFEFK